VRKKPNSTTDVVVGRTKRDTAGNNRCWLCGALATEPTPTRKDELGIMHDRLAKGERVFYLEVFFFQLSNFCLADTVAM
jgi:hypothetical protein